MDFKDKTRDDLREIIRTATEALKEYDDREKTKVYSLFLPFTGWRSFINKENAIARLKEDIEYDLVFGDDEMKIPYQIQLRYYTEAELEWCLDYIKPE